MYHRILKALLISFLFIAGMRQLSAQMYECVKTDPVTGLVTLHWNWGAIYSQTDHYEILYGPAVNAWTDSTGMGNIGPELSFTIPGSDGRINRYYILLRVITAPPGDEREVILSNIVLSLIPGSTSVATLAWNEQEVPPVYDPGKEYLVQRFENSAWKTLVTIPYTSGFTGQWKDTISTPFCEISTIDYRVVFKIAGSPCEANSNTARGSFYDGTQPSNPENDTISIFNDPTGTYTGCPILGWTRSPEKDVAGYIIYRFDGFQFNSIDTIPGDSTIFLDKSVRACLQSYTYALAAIDSCGITSYGTYSTAPHSLVLSLPDINPCDRKAYLSWNAYTEMPGGLGGYAIYRQVNNGSFTLLEQVDNATTEFVDSTLFINGNTYTYYVRAFSADGKSSSSSCQSRKTYNGPVVPDTLYIKQVSVLNNSVVDARYYYSPPNRIRQLLLERSNTPTGPFLPVDTLAASGSNFLPQEYTLTDYTANVQQQVYYYRITMIDSCNKAALFSENISNTILLGCTNTTTTNELSWNGYTAWYNGIDRYEIYRTINGMLDPSGPLHTVTTPPLEYTDNLTSIPPTAQVCYFVRALESAGNPVAPDAFSESNLTCPAQDPLFFMPNAFNPGSTNYRFRPVQAFVETGSFRMMIYNKWGQLIFETEDIYNGWDGYSNGRPAPADVYAYRIWYKSYQGESFEKRGTVTLVR